MSETTTETPLDTAPVAPVEAPETVPAVETPAEATEAPEGAPEPATEAKEAPADPAPQPKKPSQADRRFAQLTARMAAERQAREEAERRAAAVEELLRAQKGDETAPVRAPSNPAEFEDAVQREVARRAYDERRKALIATGQQELGADTWTEKTSVLHSLGATENVAFMQALVELPDAHRLVEHLADDADGLVALLNKPPVAMAAEMGRMAATLKPRVVAEAPRHSNAPRPAKPITTPAVAPEPDVYDPKISMREYNELRRKTASWKLGGSKR